MIGKICLLCKSSLVFFPLNHIKKHSIILTISNYLTIKVQFLYENDRELSYSHWNDIISKNKDIYVSPISFFSSFLLFLFFTFFVFFYFNHSLFSFLLFFHILSSLFPVIIFLFLLCSVPFAPSSLQSKKI